MASEPVHHADGTTLPPGRPAGIAIALASVLSVAFMAFHPTVHARGMTDFVAGVNRQAVVNGIVHGSLIALLGVLVCGFSVLAARLGTSAFHVRAGLVTYVMGSATLAAAALVNGFILSELVMYYRDRPPEELETMRHLLRLVLAINQVCSRAGVLAVALAIVLWSPAFLHRPGLSRAAGVLGCVAGAGLIVALLSGHLPMNVHGVLAFVLVQGVWGMGVAVLLIRNRI